MNFATGLDAFFGGARLLVRKPLRRFVWLPMATSLIVVASLLVGGFALMQEAIAGLAELLPEWLAWLTTPLTAILYLLGFLLAGWSFGLVAAAVASPFLGLLSAAAEREQFGDAPAVEERLTRAVASAVRREATKVAYHLPRLLAVLALMLVPGLNLAAPLVLFAFAAWLFAVEFVDYAAENRGLEFGETLSVLRAHRAAALAFGALPTLLLAVPFAALLVVPAAVCGGALLWRRLSQGRSAPVSP